MLNSINFKQFVTTAFLAISMQTVATNYSVASSSTAGSLDPDEYEEAMAVENTISLERTVTINSIPNIVTETTTTTVNKLDVLFLADNTNSMTDAIANVQANALSLLDTLSDTYGDVQYGVARYYGDPQENNCIGWNWYGLCNNISGKVGANGAYQLQEAVNGGTKADAIAAINNWQSSRANHDWAEGNFFALHQAATNGATINSTGTGSNTRWRSDAQKIIVWFGDAESHTSTVNKNQTIQALKNNGIKVVAIHVNSNSFGNLSLTDGLDKNLQASSIATETGGRFASSNINQLANTMLTLIGDAVTETTTTETTAGTISLQFSSEGNTSGLNITYTCIDSKGCTDVREGESRKFRMDITGNQPGQYNFKTVVMNVDGAIGNNNITVYGAD